MRHKSKNRRWSLLWRTIFLLTLFVIISQVIIYAWVQRSVSGHFEQLDSEILTHAAFNLRKRMVSLEDHIEPFTVSKSQALIDANHLHSSWLDYDLKTLVSDKNGKLLSSDPSNFINDLPADFSLLQLLQDYRDQQFMIKINNRHYRAIIITHQEVLAFIALPIDVHHQYLIQFNRQLSLILIAITLLLVSVAALSVHWGFAPLATIVQKMKGINLQRLDERIVVGDMPLELRPLTESYNSMMVKLESNFESLSRFSDNIAHELRTPIATLSTQTQVMLTKPRESDEYIEQLHHQHDTLKQLSAMINDMLLLAKTQKELSDSQISHVDIESLITKLIDYYEMIAEDREIIFEKSGDFKTVLGDKGLLQRLFANLMSNAIYYAASNSTIMISATVLTSSTSLNAPKDDIQSPEQLWLRITMTNRLDKPLNQIEADKLFERFYRHDKTNTMHSGTGLGLGLSIVQAIANAHNGKVSITIKDECLFEVAVKLLIAR
ncbi:ATP-binding protein [Psychrobacter faecalis]|uniref:histidine kinase n=1 Tax=Psychrobacter faecalis TaxID=180588 RepID=A0ABT9HGZ3_9GAMM|nr:ATP-binding protein [Psychrobacter faecalis]MDP4544739.1 histidine kinase dimerization/phospho-acceptor domain-containing protein [Psychrobacter faecalis]